MHDVKVFRNVMKMYKVSEEDIEINLTHDPTRDQIGEHTKKIMKLIDDGLHAKPKKIKYLVVVLMAGHGILKDG